MGVGGVPVFTIYEVTALFLSFVATSTTRCTLLMAHSTIKDSLIETGIPQVNLNQLNNRQSFDDIEALYQEQFDWWFVSILPHFLI